MRHPACLAPWVPEGELLEWLRDAASVDEHRRRMVVWLTHFGRWHAHEVAEMVGVSVQAVWKWVGQYNRQGPPGLRRRGRGGRRWSFLTLAQESELLRSLEARAARGDILTAKQVLPLASDAAGRLEAVEDRLMEAIGSLINSPELVTSMAVSNWLKTLPLV